MSNDFDDDYEISAAQVSDLVEDLQLNQAVHVHQLRDRGTTRVAGDVRVSPAHYRDRAEVSATGKAREIQQENITCVLDYPLLVGDVFCVAFDSEDYELAPSLAVCERCVLLDGPAYETRFRFVQAVELAPRSGPRDS